MLYGIMLAYYEDYHESAIREFNILLKKIDSNSKLIIVSNNKDLNSKYILGDNKNWEFSGWDKALEEISSIKDTDSVIFANDTFMYNNPYGKLKAFFIEKVFKYTYLKNHSKPKIILAGSTSGLESKYSICNLQADYWVSTYLFLVSGKLINKLGKRISIDQDTLDKLVVLENKKFIFDDSISLNMQEHLQDWLYPELGSKSSWYKAHDVSDEVKIKKVKTILNEKYLSAFCCSHDGEIIDINPKKLFFRVFNKSYCA